MSSSSNIGNSPDYLQYLNTELPGFPGQGGAPGKKGATENPLSQILAAMGGDPGALAALTGGNPTNAAPGTAGAPGVTGARAARAAQNHKFTRDAAASYLPPPRAPRVTAGPQTAAAYTSMANELQGAQQNAQLRTAQNPDVQQNEQMSWRPPTDASPDQMADHIAQKAGGALNTAGAYQGDMMREFMALRIKNGSDGLKELGELSDLATDIQDSQLKEQEAKSREADKEAHKAQAKAAKMGIFSKVLEVLIMVITALVAVFSFGTLAPVMAIAAAAAIAFIAGGAAQGAKNGKGFDVMGGLEIANYVADGMMVALGLGAALMAVQTAMKSAAGGVAKAVAEQMANGMKQVTEQVAEQVTKQAGSQAGKTTAQVAAEVSASTAPKEMFETASKYGFKVFDTTAERTAKAAAENAGKKVPTQVEESLAKSATKVSASRAIDSADKLTVGQLQHQMEMQMQKHAVMKALEKSGKMTIKQKAAEFSTLLKGNMASNMSKMGMGTSKVGSTVLGEDFGTRMMRMGLLLGGVQGVSALGQAGMQYQVTEHQTNAEESQAIIKLMSATVDMLKNQYSTLQNSMQTMTESRSKAIDAVQSMLRSDQQVNLMISNNFVSR